MELDWFSLEWTPSFIVICLTLWSRSRLSLSFSLRHTHTHTSACVISTDGNDALRFISSRGNITIVRGGLLRSKRHWCRQLSLVCWLEAHLNSSEYDRKVPILCSNSSEKLNLMVKQIKCFSERQFRPLKKKKNRLWHTILISWVDESEIFFSCEFSSKF